jgi:NADH-quinone oxidoreductase subunit H
MSQQGASQGLIATFIFSIALIYVAITTLLDRKKAEIAKASREINSPEPNFPVPAIPNSRVEQING